MNFCEQARQQTNLYWEESFVHPFVRGIANGTLPLENFKFYMMQDAYYLKHYTKILAMLAAKVTEDKDVAYFLETASFIREAELALHRTTFKQLGVTEVELEHFEPAPAAYNYVSHMYQALFMGTIADAYAAILPCPWLYQEIGTQIRHANPKEPLYREWVALYSSAEMKQTIEKQKEMMNRFANLPESNVKTLHEHFKRSCYYEWQFWEMSWALQNWQEGAVMI